jgi:hypothetical protein
MQTREGSSPFRDEYPGQAPSESLHDLKNIARDAESNPWKWDRGDCDLIAGSKTVDNCLNDPENLDGRVGIGKEGSVGSIGVGADKGCCWKGFRGEGGVAARGER